MSAERRIFGKLHGMESPMPDLIDIQTKSYAEFLQADVPPAERIDEGLQAIFKEIFPVASYDGRYKLDFVSYRLEPEKKGYLQALIDGESYVRPLRVTFRLQDGEDVREVGERLAASYVNYYCANGAIVLPAFGGENAASDAQAAAILAGLFPERRIISVYAREILTGGGNIHCITQQIPEGAKL